MNHRPFEDWLLEDQPLNPAQKRELDAHLRTCEACRAIAESNLALRSARIVAPAPGFSARFQERLVLARRAQRRRTLLGTLFFSLGGLLSLIGSPADWIASIIQTVLFMYTTSLAVAEAGSIILRVLPDFMPPFVWLVLLSTLSGLGLLWSVSIWRLMRRPQGAES
jgi:anti-sigma factor RsiW